LRPRVAGAHGLSSRPSGTDVDHNRACHPGSWTKGTVAEAARNQAEAVAVRCVMQVTAVISLNQSWQAATERDWGTQTGAPTPSRTRRGPTRLAACTVSSASQWVQDQDCAAGARRAEAPSRTAVHNSWARKATCPAAGANGRSRGVERQAALEADCRKNRRRMRRLDNRCASSEASRDGRRNRALEAGGR
jgi:hypothetical protein